MPLIFNFEEDNLNEKDSFALESEDPARNHRTILHFMINHKTIPPRSSNPRLISISDATELRDARMRAIFILRKPEVQLIDAHNKKVLTRTDHAHTGSKISQLKTNHVKTTSMPTNTTLCVFLPYEPQTTPGLTPNFWAHSKRHTKIADENLHTPAQARCCHIS